MLWHRAALVCGLVAIDVSCEARAEDPVTAEEQKQQRLERRFQESLGWYQLSASPNSGATMKPQPVLRWLNPVRGQKGEPTLVLWADAGRPEALASVYPWRTNLIDECVSLARGEGLTAKEGGRTVWSPGAAGVTFRAIPDSPTPAETAAARLIQAKSLAERFKVALVSVSGARASGEELRLLPRPIYRYELDAAKAAHPDLVDGAVFAFVQGTDPEAVLLVEAVRRGQGTGWQYAFRTSHGLRRGGAPGPLRRLERLLLQGRLEVNLEGPWATSGRLMIGTKRGAWLGTAHQRRNEPGPGATLRRGL